MGLQASEQATQKQQREFEHAGPTLADRIEKSTFSTPYGVFATHNWASTPISSSHRIGSSPYLLDCPNRLIFPCHRVEVPLSSRSLIGVQRYTGPAPAPDTKEWK